MANREVAAGPAVVGGQMQSEHSVTEPMDISGTVGAHEAHTGEMEEVGMVESSGWADASSDGGGDDSTATAIAHASCDAGSPSPVDVGCKSTHS